MKITCSIIQDILPLYVEDIASEDSKKMVEEHLNSCENCKQYMEYMKMPNEILSIKDELPLQKIKTKLLKKKMQIISASVLIVAAIAVIICANLIVPRYFAFSEDIVSLEQSNDGTMYAEFNDKVSGYGISSCPSDDKTGYVYHIAAWDSVWGGKIAKNDVNNVVLNPNGEKVTAVYYYKTDGSGEILLFGEQQNPCGVIIKQPKLKLLAASAAILMLICAGLLIIFRKHKHAVQNISSCLLLPVSYLLSHLLVKGTSFNGYSTAEDFWMILLCMIPIYFITFSFLYLLKFRKKKENRQA